MTEKVRVAIACQGGGAQTAFTAGVLDALIDDDTCGPVFRRHGVEYEIVGISGTSGGAVCAALTWADLMLGRRGRLRRFWTEGYPDGNAALPYREAALKQVRDFVADGRLPWLPVGDRLRADIGAAFLEDFEPDRFLPVHYTPELKAFYFRTLFDVLDLVTTGPMRFGAEQTRAMVNAALAPLESLPLGTQTRRAVDQWIGAAPIFADSPLRREFDVLEAFIALLERYVPAEDRQDIARAIQAARAAGHTVPELLIGSADVLQVHEDEDDIDLQPTGDVFIQEEDARKARETNFTVFRGTSPADLARLPQVVAASSAIPTVMRAVELNGTAYWDALYSANPPLYDLAFLHGHKHEPGGGAERNPEEIWLIRINPTTRATVPKSFNDIEDRRNELEGNLSTFHELRLVRKVDALTTRLAGKPSHERIAFGFIDMEEGFASELDYASKLDRRRERIDMLYEHGRKQGAAFLEGWGQAEEDWLETHKANAKASAG
jgi:predicted acylesterase/phospholipase RssA